MLGLSSQFILATDIFYQGILIMYILTVVLLILMIVLLYNLLIETRKTREILEKIG